MLILSLLAIAVLDGLNPSIILMTLFLLSTDRPTRRTASYIAGVFLTNGTLGVLVYFGLGASISGLIDRLMRATSWWAYAIEAAAAITLIWVAVTMKGEAGAGATTPPVRLTPVATFVLGIGATFVEFSTAAPYLAAIAVLTRAEVSAAAALVSLGLYNLVYVAIPLGLLSLYVLRGDRIQPVLARVNGVVSRWLRRVARVLFFALGLILAADVVAWLFGNPLFG